MVYFLTLSSLGMRIWRLLNKFSNPRFTVNQGTGIFPSAQNTSTAQKNSGSGPIKYNGRTKAARGNKRGRWYTVSGVWVLQ